MNETITIHGGEWKLKDLTESIAWCLAQNWHREGWKRSPALIDKNGNKTTQYLGQKFDPEKTDLVPDGWSHDHCQICYWALGESEDPEQGVGYRNTTNAWLCSECFEKLIAPRQDGEQCAAPAGADAPSVER
jgi:hypothetical protein